MDGVRLLPLFGLFAPLLMLWHAPMAAEMRIQVHLHLKAFAPPEPSTPAYSPPPAPPSPPPAPARLGLRESQTAGSFAVLVDGVEWFGVGAPTSVRHRGSTYTAAAPNTKLRLKLSASGQTAGTDTLGAYSRRWWRWSAGSRRKGALVFETAARLYSTAIVFEQLWHTEATSTNGRALTSTFPSLSLTSTPRRGFLQVSQPPQVSHGHSRSWAESTLHRTRFSCRQGLQCEGDMSGLVHMHVRGYICICICSAKATRVVLYICMCEGTYAYAYAV